MTSDTTRRSITERLLCPSCQQWIPGKRSNLDSHIRTGHPETYARQQRVRAELLGETP